MRGVLVAVLLVPAMAAADPHDGATVEVGVGASTLGRPVLGVGLGGWLRPDVVLELRIDVDLANESQYLVGPSVQYWLGEHAWIGGTAGIASNMPTECTDCAGAPGFAVRAGVAAGSLGLSAELVAGFTISTSFIVLAGYQLR